MSPWGDKLVVTVAAGGKIIIFQPSTGDVNEGVVLSNGNFAVRSDYPESYVGYFNFDGSGVAENMYTDDLGCTDTWQVRWSAR